MEKDFLINMSNRLFITLDIEADYAGMIPEFYEACDLTKLDGVFSVLKNHQIKLTVFVVGNMLERPLPIIKN